MKQYGGIRLLADPSMLQAQHNHLPNAKLCTAFKVFRDFIFNKICNIRNTCEHCKRRNLHHQFRPTGSVPIASMYLQTWWWWRWSVVVTDSDGFWWWHLQAIAIWYALQNVHFDTLYERKECFALVFYRNDFHWNFIETIFWNVNINFHICSIHSNSKKKWYIILCMRTYWNFTYRKYHPPFPIQMEGFVSIEKSQIYSQLYVTEFFPSVFAFQWHRIYSLLGMHTKKKRWFSMREGVGQREANTKHSHYLVLLNSNF